MFDKKKINVVMEILQGKYPCFVSEAHLQTAFIIEAASKYPKYEYLPEFTPSSSHVPYGYQQAFGNNGLHFDLLIIDSENDDRTLIEFKYKTRNFQATISGMKYDVQLKNHAAQILGRYDCWKDIFRIEQFTKNSSTPQYKNGFFIFITNDQQYLEKKPPNYNYGNAFSMKSGIHIHGQKQWQDNPSLKTIGEGRNHSLDIQNDYNFEYTVYTNLMSYGKNGDFQQLIVEI